MAQRIQITTVGPFSSLPGTLRACHRRSTSQLTNPPLVIGGSITAGTTGAVFPSFASFASRISASGHVGKGNVASCLIWLALLRRWLAQSPIKMPLTYRFGLGDLAVIVNNVKLLFPGNFQWSKLERSTSSTSHDCESRSKLEGRLSHLSCRRHTFSLTFKTVSAQQRHIST